MNIKSQPVHFYNVTEQSRIQSMGLKNINSRSIVTIVTEFILTIQRFCIRNNCERSPSDGKSKLKKSTKLRKRESKNAFCSFAKLSYSKSANKN
jgi:hypothetical protein